MIGWWLDAEATLLIFERGYKAVRSQGGNYVKLVTAVLLVNLLAVPALAADLPLPAAFENRAGVAPVSIEVAEPHFGSARRVYLAYPARVILDSILGKDWLKPGNNIRFKALDGYASVVDADALAGQHAFLAFAMADGSAFKVDNALQNETNIELGPWYLVWDNISDPALLRDGAVQWPYQVKEVEIADGGDAQLFPGALDEKFTAGGKLVKFHCITCHKVNGYGGDKVSVDLAEIAKSKPREELITWVLAPRSVKTDTTMPGLTPEWPEDERRQAAEAISDYLANVPILAAP